MSDINRIQGNFRGLTVQNKNNNILKMDQSGNFSLTTQTIENISYQKITNISETESVYTAKTKNLLLSSENGAVIIRNGTESQTPGYQFNNPSYSEEDDTFFDPDNTSEISKPFGSTEEVNALRNDSFLLETLGEKSMCLYSNNGLSQVSHGNMNLVGDSNILLQASQKLNLTSMGYILLNSERLLTSIEEDIHILSASGEFKVGGDGIETIGLKVNSNQENNFTSLGRYNSKADRSLHIDIQNPSYDNTKKNGIIIESKSLTNQNTFPDVKLINYDKTNLLLNDNILTQINLGIGSNNQDINNLIFVKKEIDGDGNTLLVALNNFKFTNTDVNKKITYNDTSFGEDTIKSLVITGDNENSKVIIQNKNTAEEVELFNYQEGYINRDNHGNLKTETNSDLHLGTNQNDILTIKNTGNIGINNVNPISTVEIQNTYGNINNIRKDKNSEYLTSKTIQMKDSNYIVFYNTKKQNLYNLEADIYNINNDLVDTFVIYENSYVFINFSVDNLQGIEDNFVVAYSIFNNTVYQTISEVYNSKGIFKNIKYTYIHDALLETSNPQVKSIQIPINTTTGSNYNGYALIYRNKTEQSTEIKVDLLPNSSSNLAGTVEIANELNSYLASTIDKHEETRIKTIKYHQIGYNKNKKKLLISCSGAFEIKNNEGDIQTHYLSFIIPCTLGINLETLKPTLTVNSNFKTLNSNSLTEEILGVAIQLQNPVSQIYRYAYYLTDLNQITTIKYGEYSNVTGNFENEVTITNTLTDSIATTDEQYNKIPSLSIQSVSNFIIAYQKNNIISYFDTETNLESTLTNFTQVNTPFIISIKDSGNNFLNTLVFFNNNNQDNPFLYQSINFQEIKGESNILSIKNNNNNIQVKNTGDITIQDIVEISKSKKTSTFERLIVKTTTDNIASLEGINGELKIYQDEIYVYLNNSWRKINIT